MGLNDTELTGNLVALLYKNHLIDCNSKESAASPSPASHILIVANLIGSSGENREELLSGMMNACKVAPENYRVIGLTPATFSDWSETEAKYQPAGILIFGNEDEISKADIDAGHYSAGKKNGIPLLAAPSLDNIASDKKTKMEVWENLKSFFSI